MRASPLAVVLAFAAGAAAQSVPCFENSLGTNLGAGDDTVSYNNALGFTFPGPAGPVTAIDISSNGFLWLGTNLNHDAACCSGDPVAFLAGDPRVAGYWMDLYPPGAPAGGGVFFNAIPAGGGFPARAVITWSQCPEYFSNPSITAQVQLVSTGEILINHAASNATPQSYHSPIVGVSQGNGAVDYPVQFAAIPGGGITTFGIGTAYQQYNLPPNYDLAGRTIWFLPNGQGGYLVNQVCSPAPVAFTAAFTRFAKGCPQPPVVYEFFPGTGTVDLSNHSFLFVPNGFGGYVVLPGSGQFFNGFTNNLNLGDDAVGTVTMPFTFTHPAGSTNSLDVCSNGRVWLAPNPFGTNYAPNVFEWLNDPPCIAPLWADFYPPGAAAGGGVFADADPSNNAYYVTWNNVPEYDGSVTGIGANTMQLALFNNGNFELRYQSVTNNATTGGDAMPGYSTGNGATDPGSRDLTVAVPFDTGPGGQPLSLDASPASLPILGTVFGQDISNIPVTAPIGFMVLGFTTFAPAGVDLTPLGAPGCKQYESLDADVLFFVAGSATHTFSMNIPNNAALGGTTIFTQAAVLSPGINQLGVISSNGGRMVVGL
jgi:hypothetical protein